MVNLQDEKEAWIYYFNPVVGCTDDEGVFRDDIPIVSSRYPQQPVANDGRLAGNGRKSERGVRRLGARKVEFCLRDDAEQWQCVKAGTFRSYANNREQAVVAGRSEPARHSDAG